MFIGHYGVSFACKAAKPAVPLWVLFVAVQLIDVAWAVLVLLGIEKVRIVPGITATNPFDLYYMPFTHSLPGAALWSLVAAVTYRAIAPAQKWPAAAIVGGAVFSHWILDLLVHRPDLALYDDTYKVGFGLWNYPALAFALEIALLFGGIAIYLRTTEPRDSIGRYGMMILGLVAVPCRLMFFSDRHRFPTRHLRSLRSDFISRSPRLPIGLTQSARQSIAHNSIKLGLDALRRLTVVGLAAKLALT